MVKLLKNALLIVLIITGLSMLSLVALLRSGAISDERLVVLLEEGLSTADGNVKASIDHASLNWQQFDELGVVDVSRLTLQDASGNIFASFAKLRVRLDPLAWVFGGQKFSELIMLRPQLYLQRNEHNHWRLGSGGKSSVASLGALFGGFSSSSAKSKPAEEQNIKQLLPFKRVIAQSAQIYVTDDQNTTTISSSNANIIVQKRQGALEVQLEAPFTLKDESKRMFVGMIMLIENEKSHGEVFVKHLPLNLLCQVIDCDENMAFEGEFNGSFSPVLNDFILQTMTVNGLASDVVATIPDMFAEPLLINKASMLVDVDAVNHVATFRTLELSNNDLSGSITGQLFAREEGYSADIEGRLLSPMKAENLYKYWPIISAPDTRQWVVSNLTKGVVPNADIHLTIHPGDLEKEHLPDGMLRSSVEVQDMQVQFLPGFPALKSVNGVVHFTGTTLKVASEQATFLNGTHVSKAHLQIDDLFHPNVPMKAELVFDAAASDAVKLLSQKEFTFDDALQLDADTISGRIKGTSRFAFDAYKEGSSSDKPQLDNVKYDLELNLLAIAQPNFLGRVALSDVHAYISASPGNAAMNKASAVLDGYAVNVGFLQEDGGSFTAQVKGDLPVAVLEQPLGEKARWFEAGKFGADIDIAYGKSGVRLNKAAFDLTDTALSIDEINVSKPAGVKSSIHFQKQQREAAHDVLGVAADLGDLQASGAVHLATNGDITEVNLQRLSLPETDIQLRYQALQNGDWVTLTGKTLDIHTPYTGKGSNLLAEFPSLKLSINLDALILVETHPFTQVQGVLDCIGRCNFADLSAKVNDSDVKVNITGHAGQNRRLNLYASDAGEFLKALNATDKVFKGALEVKGEYQESLPDTPLKARAILQDFTLKNSQIFARLFSVASLTGLSNLLTGSGIAFEKFSMDIDHNKGFFTMRDGRARGNAMGFTAEGTVNSVNSDLNIKGVLVPAFFINSLVGEIPIIGELAGGAGEGIIAFNYSVKGNYADPEVFVNPFSGLTPGFLRNIFNVFDAPAESKAPAGETGKPDASQTPPSPEPIISDKSQIIR